MQKASSTNKYLAFGRKKAQTNLTFIYHFWQTSPRKFMRHLKKKYADRIKTKYAAEIWHRIAWNQLPHLVPQGSRHKDGAIQLVEVTKPIRNT